MEKAFLIDGNSFCYRAFYAIRELRTSYGQPTNAVYGFVMMLNLLLKKERPDYIAITFDLKEPTFRHKAFKDYKVHRPPMPDELISQLPMIRRIIEAYRIPIFEKEGFEADDVIGTLAKKLANSDIEVYIVTGDKDILQLVNSHIKVYNTHKEGLIYDEQKVKERFGVEPGKLIDIVALTGDASDNIPGVTGIGDKVAVELIKEFGSLENLFSNISKVKDKTRQHILQQSKEQAMLSKWLATLVLNVPVKMSLEDLKLVSQDKIKLAQLFKEFEFRSLLKDLLQKDSMTDDGIKYEVISTEEELHKFLKVLREQKIFAFDIHCDGKEAMTAKMVGISFSYKINQAHYIPAAQWMRQLKPILEDDSRKKIGHDLKFKKLLLRHQDINLRGISFDTMIASYLLAPHYKSHTIEDLGSEFLVYSLNQSDPIKRSCEISCIALKLKAQLEHRLKTKGLINLFKDIEMPLINVLADMELAGVGIDRYVIKRMSKELEEGLKRLRHQIVEIAEVEFNINSPKQLAVVLFERLKLPILKRTKTGPSTDVEVLKDLTIHHALPGILLEYRELMKLKTTYVDALPELIHPEDKRLHTSFNQTVTATGRLSSSQPNLQNIPIRTELGLRLRQAFIATKSDYILLSADYSQIELRILAHLSKDENLISVFKKGGDIHTVTASLIYGVRLEDISPRMRDVAKTVNFGIVYGMSAYGLSRELGIDQNTATNFIEAYFNRYPKVQEYLRAQIESARKNGYVVTLFGRRRQIPDINSSNNVVKQSAERTAVNTPVQGTAADIIKIAMIKLHNEINEAHLKTRMVLQVHDELVFEVPADEVNTVKELIHHNMVGAAKLCVPIEVSIKTGKNWTELC